MIDRGYNAIFLFVLISFSVSVIILLLGLALGNRKVDTEKASSYECGFPSRGSARAAFNVNFFVVAILFVVFDVEIIFLLPWAIYLAMMDFYSICTIAFFFLILASGLILEIKNKAIDW